MTKFAGKWKVVKPDPTKMLSPVVSGGPVVQAVHRPGKYVTHGGTAKPNMQYTGTAILGIGVMHKSNATPVFSQDEAIDLAHMRR